MSRARVDQIVNQIGNGPVEFPEGLTVSAGKPLSVLGPVKLNNSVLGTAGQIIKAGVNSELVWADSDSVSISAQDGPTADRKLLKISTAGSANTTSVVLKAGSNVTLTRATDEIRIDSTYVNDDTITRLQASGGTLVTGDVVFTASGAASVSQTGQTITYSSTDTTYTAGTGITLSGGEFSIPQAVATTSTPTFAALTLTGNIGAVNGNFSGDVTGTWAGGVISIANGGTGNSTAASAFLALAPTVSSSANKFLKTDGSTIFWDNLPSSGGFTPLTYDLTGEDGPSTNTAKIRLTDSDSNYDDITLAASNDITIGRVGNTITIGSNFNNTNLTQEQIEDFVAGMMDNSLNTNITITYDDAAGKLAFSGSAGGGGSDGNHTYDFQSSSITGGAALDLVPGGTGAGEATDSVNLKGGTNCTVVRDSGTGEITINATDTDTDTVTRLQVTGPGTTGGAFASGDISIQASGSITLAQSGTTLAIGASDTNSYVSQGYYNAVNGTLFLERTDSLSDVEVPVSNLESYFNTKYASQSGLVDAKISSASFNTTTGVLSLSPNDGTADVTVDLDGRYVTSEGPNTYVSSGVWTDPTNTPPGYHSGRKVLQLNRNDLTSLVVESEPLLDYLDTLYAPITATDTRVDAFTWTGGNLYLSVSNGDTYTHNIDSRYVQQNDYIDNAVWDTSNGMLTLEYGHNTPGSGTDKTSIQVDLDGRYRLATTQDIAIASVNWNASTGMIQAVKNDSSATTETSLDGRYFDSLSVSGTTVTMVRSSGTNASFQFPAERIDIPDGTKILCYQSSAPTGYVKETSVNDYALRVVSGSGGGSGSGNPFSTTFASGIDTGGSVGIGSLDAASGGTWSTSWPSGSAINHNFRVNGSINAQFASGTGIGGSANISGNANANSNMNYSIAGTAATSSINTANHGVSGGQGAQHWHNYYRPGGWGTARWDDGTVCRGEYVSTTDGAGSGSGHSHYINSNCGISGYTYGGSGNISVNSSGLSVNTNGLNISGGVNISQNVTGDVSGSADLPGAPLISTGNIGLNGSPSYTAGTINMNVQYIDVIICRRDPSGG